MWLNSRQYVRKKKKKPTILTVLFAISLFKKQHRGCEGGEDVDNLKRCGVAVDRRYFTLYGGTVQLTQWGTGSLF